MTSTPLHVLLVATGGAGEPDLAAALQAAGFSPSLQNVAEDVALPGALDAGPCDLVLLAAEPSPGPTVGAVLTALQARSLDVPVIVVADRTQIDAAIAAVAAGAHDYVEREDLRRLGPAVRRELRAAAERRERATFQQHRAATSAEADERYRAISELTSDCAYALRVLPDGDLRIEWVTNAYTRLTGYALDEIVGRNGWQALIPVDDLPAALRHLEALLAGTPSVAEYRVVTRSGETRRLQDYGHPVWDDVQARVVRILGAIRDVGAQRSLEEALRDSEERIRAIAELSADVAYTARVDADGRVSIEWATAALASVMGYTLAEVKAPEFWQTIIYPEDLPRAMQHLQTHLRGRPDLAEYRVATRRGEIRWFQDYGHPIWDDAQQRVVRIFGAIRDVTEQRRTEEALRESERQLAEAQRLAQLGSWSRDLHTDREQWSDELFRLCGLQPGSMEPTYAAYLAAVHPDDRAAVQQIVERSVAAHASYTYQCRIARPDGTIRHVLSRARIAEEGGRPARLYGTVQDITEQVQAQVALLASELRFRDLVERAADAVFLHDQQGIILDVNQQACGGVGYTREELLGMNIADIEIAYGPEQLAAMWIHLVDGNPMTLTGTHRRKDGTAFPVEVRISQFESQGERLVLALARDITERQRTEEALRQTNETLEALIQASPLAIATYDRDGKVTRWNPAAERIFGWGAEEVLGRVTPSLPPDRADETRQFGAQLLAGRRITDIETERLRRDGQRIAISLSAAPLRDADGEVRSAMAIMADISARKAAEEQLRRRAAELQGLYDTALKLNAQLEPAELLRVIVEQATALLEAQAGGLFLYHPESDVLQLEVGVGHFWASPPLLLKVEEGLSGKAFAGRQSLMIDDYTQWEGHSPEHGGDTHLKAMLAVPLLGREEALGVLTISGERRFDEHDRWLAELFAAQAAVALENARLHAQLERRARQLAALNTAGQVMTSTLDLHSVLDEVIGEVKALLNAASAWVLLCTRDDDGLTFAAAAGPDSARLVGTRMPPGAGIAGWSVRERRPVLVNDTQNDPRYYKNINVLTGVSARSVLAVPLIAHGDVVGVLEAVHREPNAFSTQDLATLEAMAASAAIAIENARLYQAEREQYRRLQQSQTQLINSEKQAALGRLIASLAHELNNPLQAMQNCMELILEFPLDAVEQREYQLAVQRETNRLMTLCNRVLDFARPVVFERQVIDVVDSARYALTLAGKQLEHGGIAVVLDLPAALPHVLAAHDRLAQVFLNLIINASEAMPGGGELRIAARAVDGQVELTVTDTGPGIAADALSMVFEPLYTTKEAGTGLGLPICHNIIEQHGGTITAGNVPGGGAVITVRLPSAE